MEDNGKTITYNEVRKLTISIANICQNILTIAGPYHKECVYQSLLIHELTKMKDTIGPVIRERVLPLKFKDCDGQDIFVGDNQCMRTDIEIPKLAAILEIKASANKTKTEHRWQLLNYLRQQDDRHWGIVINFINIFNGRINPHVECVIVYPITHEIITREILTKKNCDTDIDTDAYTLICTIPPVSPNYNKLTMGIKFPMIWSETICTKEYPPEDTIVFEYDETIKYIKNHLE